MWRYEIITHGCYRVYEHTGDAGFAVPNRLLAGRVVDLLNADDDRQRRTECRAAAEQIGAILGAGGERMREEISNSLWNFDAKGVRAELDKRSGTV